MVWPGASWHERDMNEKTWMKLALELRGWVIPTIWKQVVLSMFFAAVVVLFNITVFSVERPILPSLIPSVVLGLLLVVRTNTAYDRFWEGRKLTGKITALVSHLAVSILTFVSENKPADKEEKIAQARLGIALFITIKLHLRKEEMEKDSRLLSLLSQQQYDKLKGMGNRPLVIIKWLNEYFNSMLKDHSIGDKFIAEWNNTLEEIIVSFFGCNRILTTPLPKAYSIHLRQMLLLYCYAIPFQLVEKLHWGTVPAVGVISFALLGIEAIGLEIEDPFGYDPNDIPLDAMADKLHGDIEELIGII